MRSNFPASLPILAIIPTCILGGLMGQAFGRRLSLLLVAPIFAVSFILQAIAEEVAMFQFGRFLSGIAAGLLSGPASVNCTIVIRLQSTRVSYFFCKNRRPGACSHTLHIFYNSDFIEVE